MLYLKTFQDTLRNNETYRQISHMEEKLSDILKDNKSLQASVDDLNKVCMHITLDLIKIY